MTEGFWWAALAVATASAAAHLVTMLGTRWGDRGVSTKAFLFSLLAHAALFSGLFAVGPKLDRFSIPVESAEEPDPDPITVREVLTDAGDPSVPSAGDVPVWDRPTEPTPILPDRAERPFEVPQVAETPRTVEPPPSAERAIPSAADLPTAEPAVPQPVTTAVPEMTPEVAQAPQAEEETAEARPEERAGPPLARTDLSSAAESGEGEPVDRSALPAAADRTAPELDPARQITDLPTADEPPDLPAADVTDDPARIETATAPLDAPIEDVAGAGDVGEGAEGDAAASSRFSPRRTDTRDFSGDLPSNDRGRPEGDSAASARPTTRDLSAPSVEEFGPPAADQPVIGRPAEEGTLAGRGAELPETYQLRQIEGRSDVARRNGGTEASEQAVEAALEWLASTQNPAGYWDADAYGAGQVAKDEDGIDRKNAGKTADSGVTALAVLAFHGAGYTRDEGLHAETVEKALAWLVANQRADGYLGGKASNFERMYCHGMATYALAEAHGMRADPSDVRLRRPLEKAVAYTVSQQGDDGGWRYEPDQAGDMSMFGWHLMALRSADIAGVPVPAVAKTRAIRFLKDRSAGESGGLAAYLENQRPTPSMTAEALFCKQMLGITRTNPASVEAVSFLLKNTPRRSKLDLYYWYYGTLAMYQYGGPDWETWNAALRDLLVAEQVKQGDAAGSWEPRDAWGPYGGRVYSTAIAALSLEVYYRFLPLYRVGDESPPGKPAGPQPRTSTNGSRPSRTSPP